MTGGVTSAAGPRPATAEDIFPVCMSGQLMRLTVGFDEMERIAERAADMAVKKYTESDVGRCGLCNENGFAEKHERHHEFIEAAIEFFGRLNDLKWSSIKAVFSFLLVGLVAAFLYFFFGIKTS